jgi:small multidrug resistance pump
MAAPARAAGSTTGSAEGLLAVAVAGEIGGAIALRYADGFTRLWPTLAALASFTLALTLVSRVMQTLRVSIAYPVWAGAGTACVAAIGVTVLGEDGGWRKGLGVALVVAGIVTLNLASSYAA